jgi:subtilisin family serine protease
LPPFNFNNVAAHPALHRYFRHYHDVFGGLIFMSAGNDFKFDPVPRMHYLNMVSAVDANLQLADFGRGKGSNFGNSIEFTAPGKNIVCSGPDGSSTTVNGTSFSSPIVASIAALVWGANSSLTNTQVESILRRSCFKTRSGNWNQFFGFGMPDAAKAVNMARGN